MLMPTIKQVVAVGVLRQLEQMLLNQTVVQAAMDLLTLYEMELPKLVQGVAVVVKEQQLVRLVLVEVAAVVLAEKMPLEQMQPQTLEVVVAEAVV
jgi:hypothetical protein